MNKLICAALALATLTTPALSAAARDRTKPVQSDGYKLDHKEFERLEPRIQFVFFPSKEALFKFAATKASASHLSDGSELADVVALRKDGTCVVYMVDPSVLYDPTYLGHATAHCIYGRFHKPPSTGPRMTSTSGY